MSSEIVSFAQEDPNPWLKVIEEDQRPGGSSASVKPNIEFVTENGFSIVRLSELDPATVDSESECYFLIRQPDGDEGTVSVAFEAPVVAQVQSQRINPLPATSDFWLTLAEQHLATYLWRNNNSPASGHLVISQLSSENVMLAARWRD